MKQRFFQFVALAALALFALAQPRAFALTTADIAGRWIFTISFDGETPYDQPWDLDADGNIYDPNYGGDGSFGTFAVDGTSFGMSLTGYPGYVITVTGSIDEANATASGSISQLADFDGGDDEFGTFTAVGTVKKKGPTLGKLTYKELDAEYVIGSTAFIFFKYTISGSITLNSFPNTDPKTLVLPADTELKILFGIPATPDFEIRGGKLADANITDKAGRHMLFFYSPFEPDAFFDGLALLKIPTPKAWKTDAPSLTCVWQFTGPPKKPATGLKFAITGVGRSWVGLNGGGVNFQGSLSKYSGLVGDPSETITDLKEVCTITFGNSTKNVLTAFDLTGRYKVTTKLVATPSDKKKVKDSTVTVTLGGKSLKPLP